MTLSTNMVESLIDRMLDIKKELKQDITRVEDKVDAALADLKAIRKKLNA